MSEAWASVADSSLTESNGLTLLPDCASRSPEDSVLVRSETTGGPGNWGRAVTCVSGGPSEADGVSEAGRLELVGAWADLPLSSRPAQACQEALQYSTAWYCAAHSHQHSTAQQSTAQRELSARVA